MSITAILNLLGGIGMFLYGMDYLGDALKKAAGVSLERILEKLTNNKTKGLLLGTAVTAIIQSSAATAIIVIGFVNASIMNLEQGIPVVLGSNIGSTVTGQLLRLGDISNQNIILTLLKPSSFAPILIAIGVFLIIFVKKKKLNTPASIMLGLGLLFFGMTTMEQAISPLKDNEQFQQLFFLFQNPILGILAGMLVTAVIQSSSASVGILQAITSTGTVTWGMAIPIILGQNIGKCLPVFISSLSANREAKRVAIIHIITNVFGAVFWGGLIYLGKAIFDFPFWNTIINRGNVADFHTLYNAATAILLLPFTQLLARLSDHMIRNKEDNEWVSKQFELLNEMFLKTPAVALEQSRRLACDMGEVTLDSFGIVEKLFDNYDEKLMKELEANEQFLDRAETKLCEYLVRITERNLELKDTRLANELLRSIGDFERIGDYCKNLARVIEMNQMNGVQFSQECQGEIHSIFAAVESILRMTVDAYIKEDLTVASRIEPLEEVIDSLQLLMADRHVERLQKSMCSVQAGISLTEILNSMERISGHCTNVAIFLMQRLNDPYKFDAHEHLKQAHQEMSEEYKALYTYYESLYYMPVANAKRELKDKSSQKPELPLASDVKTERKGDKGHDADTKTKGKGKHAAKKKAKAL